MSDCQVCPVYGRTGDPGKLPPNQTEHGWLVCPQCQGRVRRHLQEIPEQYRELDAAPGGTPGGSRISGSKEQNLGVRVGVLDLIVPASLATVRDEYADQVGVVPVATRLAAWVADWIDTGAPGSVQPAPTVEILTGWLSVPTRLDWACKHHPAIDDFAAEVKEIIGALYAVNGHAAAKPEHMAGIPCPGLTCDMMALYRTAGDIYVECDRCGRLLNPEEYTRWLKYLHLKLTPRQRDCGQRGHGELKDTSTPGLSLWECAECETTFRRPIPRQRTTRVHRTISVTEDLNSRGGRS